MIKEIKTMKILIINYLSAMITMHVFVMISWNIFVKINSDMSHITLDNLKQKKYQT